MGQDGVFTSLDPNSVAEDAPFFFTAKLTQEQIRKLLEETEGIEGIEPDVGAESEGLLSNYHPKRASFQTENQSHLDKRRQGSVIVQQPADRALSFISTLEGSNRNADGFAYFANAGAGVTVYIIDSGANPQNEEIAAGKIARWLFAIKAGSEESDREGHGSCVASKVAGKKFGSAKLASLIIVKVIPALSSILDAFAKIIRDLRSRTMAGENLRGYTVVTISVLWSPPKVPGITERRFEGMLETLLNEFQVVLTVAAGNSNFKSRSRVHIDLWPSMLSLKYPIITVGAVRSEEGQYYGKRFDWSKGGPALVVSAPGRVLCGDNAPGASMRYGQGTSFATPAVAGVIAGLLSQKYMGAHLRDNDNIPLAVFEFVQKLAFSRYDDDLAISNGLSPDPGPLGDYGWPYVMED